MMEAPQHRRLSLYTVQLNQHQVAQSRSGLHPPLTIVLHPESPFRLFYFDIDPHFNTSSLLELLRL